VTARAALLLVIASIVACTLKVAPTPWSGVDRMVVFRSSADGSRRGVLRVEVAADDVSRQRGLGGRPSLAPDSGMLFVYPRAQHRMFWMKNCLIGLDIAFVDETGRIANVATLGPGAGLPDIELPRADSAGPVRYVVEAEAGWLARHGIAPGDEVDLSAALVGVLPR
jgi:uncharacterized membrane protein (UPF0127 family)